MSEWWDVFGGELENMIEATYLPMLQVARLKRVSRSFPSLGHRHPIANPDSFTDVMVKRRELLERLMDIRKVYAAFRKRR